MTELDLSDDSDIESALLKAHDRTKRQVDSHSSVARDSINNDDDDDDDSDKFEDKCGDYDKHNQPSFGWQWDTHGRKRKSSSKNVSSEEKLKKLEQNINEKIRRSKAQALIKLIESSDECDDDYDEGCAENNRRSVPTAFGIANRTNDNKRINNRFAEEIILSSEDELDGSRKGHLKNNAIKASKICSKKGRLDASDGLRALYDLHCNGVQIDSKTANQFMKSYQAKIDLAKPTATVTMNDPYCSSVPPLNNLYPTCVQVRAKYVNALEGSDGGDDNQNLPANLPSTTTTTTTTLNLPTPPDDTTVQMLIKAFLQLNKLKSSKASVGMIYNGKVLHEHQTLSHYSINHPDAIIDATVYLSNWSGRSNGSGSLNTVCTEGARQTASVGQGGYNSVVAGKKIMLSVVEGIKGTKRMLSIGMKQPLQVLLDLYTQSQQQQEQEQRLIMTPVYGKNSNTCRYRLKFDGDVVDLSKTPTHYDMENEDQIDVIQYA